MTHPADENATGTCDDCGTEFRYPREWEKPKRCGSCIPERKPVSEIDTSEVKADPLAEADR
jgi:hypothetical protein